MHPPAPTAIGPRNGLHPSHERGHVPLAGPRALRGPPRPRTPASRSRCATCSSTGDTARHGAAAAGSLVLEAPALTRRPRAGRTARPARDAAPRRPAPTRPGGVFVAAVGEGSIAVRFGRSHDDFGVAGYRVRERRRARDRPRRTAPGSSGLACGMPFTIEAWPSTRRARSAASPPARARTRACTRTRRRAPTDVDAPRRSTTQRRPRSGRRRRPRGQPARLHRDAQRVELGRPARRGFIAAPRADDAVRLRRPLARPRRPPLGATATLVVRRARRSSRPARCTRSCSRRTAAASPTSRRTTGDRRSPPDVLPPQVPTARSTAPTTRSGPVRPERGVKVLPRVSRGPTARRSTRSSRTTAAATRSSRASPRRRATGATTASTSTSRPAHRADRCGDTTFVQQLASALHARARCSR